MIDLIPANSGALQTGVEIVRLPSNAFRIDFERGEMAGQTDGLDAMAQAVFLILSTERYEHVIYDWNYGVELAGLIGKPIPLVLPEIKRRISEALLQDDRITAVTDFAFEVSGRKVHATFTVKTIFGEIQTERMVEA